MFLVASSAIPRTIDRVPAQLSPHERCFPHVKRHERLHRRGSTVGRTEHILNDCASRHSPRGGLSY